MTGIPPFNGKDDQQIMERVSQGDYRLDIPEFENVSGLAKRLIKKMLEMSSTKRISAKKAINDEWFSIMRTADDTGINLSTLNNLRKLNVSSPTKFSKILTFSSINPSSNKPFIISLLLTWLLKKRKVT